jgi:hypothetical protein
MIRQHNLLLATNSLLPPCQIHNDVNAAIEDNCNVIRYALTKPDVPSRHNASLAVLTRRLSLLPENNPEIAPATPNPGNPDNPLDSDKMQLGTAENIHKLTNFCHSRYQHY